MNNPMKGKIVPLLATFILIATFGVVSAPARTATDTASTPHVFVPTVVDIADSAAEPAPTF